jgi:hypothetical protein
MREGALSVSVATQLREEYRRSWFEPETEQLLKTTLDDLVKYNIVRLLRDNHTTLGNEVFFASTLGFHSCSRTREALEDLVQAGVLQKWAGSRDSKNGDAVFGLTANEAIRQSLDRVYAISPESPVYGELLRRLAERSLKRAKNSGKRKRGQPKETV